MKSIILFYLSVIFAVIIPTGDLFSPSFVFLAFKSHNAFGRTTPSPALSPVSAPSRGSSLDRQSRAWLAFGDLRGHIEPCGCDPATDMGGVRRIDMLIKKERQVYPQLKVWNLGHLLEGGLQEKYEIKNEYLLRSLAVSEITASLVGPSELQQQALLQKLAKREPHLFKQMNFLLSNVASNQKIFPVQKMMEKEDYQVFGYFYDPRWSSVLDSWNVQKFEDMVRKAGGLPSRGMPYRVLLYRGPKKLLKEVADAKLFDVVISGNNAPDDKLAGQDEKLDEEKLEVLREPLIYQVPLGGQGMIRGGVLQNQQNQSIEDILKTPDEKQNPSKTTGHTPVSLIFSTKRSIVTWLMPQVGNSARLDALFAEYEAQVKKAFAQSGSERVKDLASSSYAGVSACRTCHLQAAEIHQASSHARAMDTLVKKGKAQDPSCVVCHSVGFGSKGGFVSIEDSPFLSNVQCENCHGPRKDHSLNPTVPEPSLRKEANEGARKVCVQCHNAQHSPRFNAETYWEKIKHSQ